ncbi:odorant receptor 98a-like [Drosophila sulfurigaster albostrigata]|uniref:odorant receptor 98a-like n=1 Tax=Drosophila sulfurigaster albostrigata TaxID=89887 RepID=UPI002D21CA3F|nr:odorant receptor 98a-like [Drosophila sulfurigaster albostrigata]
MINIMFFANLTTGISHVFYLCALTCQTFPFCYTCTLIDADCDVLAFSIFNSNWLDATPRYKSTLRHFLHHAQKNITFTAGSIFPISLNTNISVAKLAFSVVTFVKQMNIVEKLNGE